MRQFFEEQEARQLKGYALKSIDSLGRLVPEPLSENRTCFQRDRDRIIHAKAFRRLNHKTQVFIALESDHYRSRLTHSMEVSQISRHLARMLQLNEDVCEAVALSHDLGHPPFGHSGERALNELMKPFGGFEHNQQSLRVVDLLETKYPHLPGLNLSHEIRDALKKHQSPWDQRDKEMRFVSLEAQVVNLADQVTYNNHDIDDGLRSGILNEEDLYRQVPIWKKASDHIESQYQDLTPKQRQTLVNSYLISSQIMDIVATTQSNIQKNNIQTTHDLEQSPPLVSFSTQMEIESKILRKHLFEHLYMNDQVYRQNKKGQDIIVALFQTFQEDPKLLPKSHRSRIKDSPLERVICDYIAGMTDVFARKEYEFLC